MSKSCSVIRMAAASGAVFAMTVVGHGVSAAQPNESPATKASLLIKPAVVYLETHFNARVLDANGREVKHGEFATRCTGFSVSADGYIGTAGHCVDLDSQRDDIIRAVAKTMAGNSGKTADQWFDYGKANWTVQVAQKGSQPDRQVLVSGAGQRDKDVKPLPARVVSVRPLGEGDVALLKVELTGKTLPAAELSKQEPAIGEQILAVGYPASTDQVTDFSLDPAVKSGTISAKQVWKTQRLLQISAPTSQGMSGGPTVDMKGQVLGVISFNPQDEQQPFNFIAPVQGITELLQSQGVDTKPNPADAAYRNGVNDYVAGKYGDAITNFDNALALSPGYPGAFDLRTDAVKLRAQAGDTSGGSGPKTWIIILAIVVIAALIGGGVLVFALSRRNKEPALAGGGSLPGDPGRATPPRPPSVGAPAGYAAPAAPGPGGGAPPPPPSSGAEVHCNNCGYSLAPGAQFCPRCGKPQG